MKIIAMIPARMGSTRLKYKNLALINNKPLIYYSISLLMLLNIREILIITNKQDKILFNKQLMIKKIKFSHDTKDLININNFKINKNFFYILYGKSGTGKS